MSISNYFENAILDHMLRAQAFTPPATIYASLHSADPGETGASEITGGGYVRDTVAFNAASSGSIASNVLLRWDNMPAVTITHLALWDALSGGNCLWSGALSTQQTFTGGEAYEIPIGSLTVSLD